MKLQTIRREYELLQMKEDDTISDYFTKIRSMINQMKGCGEVMRDQLVVENLNVQRSGWCAQCLKPRLAQLGASKVSPNQLDPMLSATTMY
ncbi:hypothetical protein Lal_00045265 [Lupinus albus]|nr:hypothetical protein Lal_00045265 [Lupinus albus]